MAIAALRLQTLRSLLPACRTASASAFQSPTHQLSRTMTAGATQRAVVVPKNGDRSVLTLKADWPKPTPGPGEVLVRNVYAGINMIDTYFRNGLYPREMPFVSGQDGAGYVEQLGEAVTDLAVGDRVAYTAPATYAEFTVAPADKVVRVPESVGLDVATAGIIQGQTAVVLGTRVYPLQAGEFAVVYAAAGGTGQLLVQVAAQQGAHVIGIVSTEEKAKIAKSLGAEHVLVGLSGDALVNEVKRLTGGEGAHVVYDSVGKATFQDSTRLLRVNGHLVSYGNASGKVPPIDISTLPNAIRISRPSVFTFTAAPGAWRKLAEDVLDRIQKGKLKVNIYARYPLEKAELAHRDLEERLTTGKVLLEVSPDKH